MNDRKKMEYYGTIVVLVTMVLFITGFLFRAVWIEIMFGKHGRISSALVTKIENYDVDMRYYTVEVEGTTTPIDIVLILICGYILKRPETLFKIKRTVDKSI